MTDHETHRADNKGAESQLLILRGDVCVLSGSI